MSGIERGEVDGEGVFLEGIAIDLREVPADGAARVVEQNHHVPLPVQHALHVLRGQDDLYNQRKEKKARSGRARWARRRGRR